MTDPNAPTQRVSERAAFAVSGRAPSIRVTGRLGSGGMGSVYLGFDDAPAELFAGLLRAAEERDPFVLMLPLRVSWYDGLRNDPRFADVAARLGLPPTSTSP